MNNTEKRPKLDMLNGSIWNKIPQYALPVAATGILEQLFNASDIAIVGNYRFPEYRLCCCRRSKQPAHRSDPESVYRHRPWCQCRHRQCSRQKR